MTVNIRFCGGCNPRYDRGKLAKKIMQKYKDFRFVTNAVEETDALVVLCGCSAVCTDVSACRERHGRIIVCEPDAWDKVCGFLDGIRDKQD